MEKARAFFRSLELKHLGSSSSSNSSAHPSSSRQLTAATTTTSTSSNNKINNNRSYNSNVNLPCSSMLALPSSICSSSSSSIIDDSHHTISATSINDSSVKCAHHSNDTATARVIRVINTSPLIPNDTIVYRNLQSEQDHRHLSYLNGPQMLSPKNIQHSAKMHYNEPNQTDPMSIENQRKIQTKHGMV